MPKAIALKLQDSVDDLKAFYRASTDAVERRRVQVIWFLAEGKSQQEVVALTAYNRMSVCDAVKRYNAEGLKGLRDRRHENPGCPPLISEEERFRLLEAMQEDNEGVWSARRIQHWVKEQLSKEVYTQRATSCLTGSGLVCRALAHNMQKQTAKRKKRSKKRLTRPRSARSPQLPRGRAVDDGRAPRRAQTDLAQGVGS